MKVATAVITGYAKDPGFVKILLDALNKQTTENFDCYIYASPPATHYLENDFDKNLKFECHHIILNENKGFAGNNNVAIETAFRNKKYEHIVLVNDDTIPDKNWLKELISPLKLDTSIGAVSSKMLFYQQFITLKGYTSTSHLRDERMLGIRFYNNTGFDNTVYPKRFIREGFFQLEEDEIYAFRWTKDSFSIELPVNPSPGSDYKLKLFIRKNPQLDDQELKLMMGPVYLTTITLQNNKIYYEIQIPAVLIEQNWHSIIQNAGTELTPEKSYEIGFSEIDKGQYDKEKEISLFCGGSCLITRKALLETGLFMEGLFSYYEDSDLSMRVRKKGYKIWYNPKSIIYHYHTGTSKEWSPLFTYYAFRNKIIFAAKTFGVNAFLKSYYERWKETYWYLKQYVKSKFKNKEYKDRLRMNILILKDSLIGIIKFKPKPLTK